MESDLNVYWIDLFCGAGGTSTGIHLSGENTKVIACVNHDINAINSHRENHPDAEHFTEDIRDFEVVLKIKKLVDRLRAIDPGCFINLWASLECTNFSKAKGGQPRNADSRTLADHMVMYLVELNPDYFWVENVREFMAWGPLCENGKPISRKNGLDYLRWVNEIKACDYEFDWRLLNAADFGAYQSRERLFLQFAKPGLPLKWPEPTHTRIKKNKGTTQTNFLEELSIGRTPWKAVKDVLDLQDEGISIFTRPKPLSVNTLKRILTGLYKFVAKGERSFTKQYNSGNDAMRVKSLGEPIGTITTGNSHGIVNTSCFITQRNGGDPEGRIIDINGPARTITQTGGNQDVVVSTYLNTYYGNGGTHSINEPAPTVTTKDRITKVNAEFLVDYQFNSQAHSLEDPAPTLVTKDKFALLHTEELASQFIMNQYTSGGQHTDINGPSSAVTNIPKQNLVSVNLPWIMNTNFNNVGRSIEEPAATVMACRKHPYLINANSSTSSPNNIDAPAPTITSGRTHYLINPAWGGNNGSVEQPCCTIVARQDKAPIYLVNAAVNQNFTVDVTKFLTDRDYCFMTDEANGVYGPRLEKSVQVQIIEFMAEHAITDIKMRMLKIPELKQIQGFPIDYKLVGTQTEQKKYIGNAVEVTIAKALVTCNYNSLLTHSQTLSA